MVSPPIIKETRLSTPEDVLLKTVAMKAPKFAALVSKVALLQAVLAMIILGFVTESDCLA